MILSIVFQKHWKSYHFQLLFLRRPRYSNFTDCYCAHKASPVSAELEIVHQHLQYKLSSWKTNTHSLLGQAASYVSLPLLCGLWFTAWDPVLISTDDLVKSGESDTEVVCNGPVVPLRPFFFKTFEPTKLPPNPAFPPSPYQVISLTVCQPCPH